ncbi:MAG: BatD family protein [Bacteroidales bacterium]|nr:BatD family protein [Bacteroidales bacterium]
MSALKYILTLAILLTVTILQGQDPSFSASAPATVQAGQQFQYTIEGNEQGNIQLPALEHFDLLAGPFTSFSSSTQWVNGKMTARNTASYTYILRGNTPGEFTIPPAKISVKKQTYSTNAVQVNVTGTGNAASSASQGGQGGQTIRGQADAGSQTGNAGQPVFLRVLPSKRSVYVGEQFVSELKVYTSVNTRPTGGLKEVPYEGFYKQALEADQVSSRENIDGKMHVTQVLQRHVLIPQKSGKIVIDPFDSEWTIPRRVNRQRSGSIFDEFFDDPFNDPFFDQYQDVPVTISTEPVTINVKPLPQGVPEGFTGGVGDLEFSARLSADQVTVNDALSLVVTVRGTGNIALLGAPKIDFPPDHDVYETTRSTNISTSGNRVSGTVTFEYPIVARHAGNFRIAPLRFSWFDPAAETYRTVTTKEYTFNVLKGEGTDTGAQIFMPGARGENVENIGTDILDINRGIPLFRPVGITPLSHTGYWIIYVVLIFLFIGSIIVLRTWFRQRADVRLMRNRKASKMARNRLRLADKARKAGDGETFFEEVEKAIWGYLADKLSIEVSSLSRDRVSEVLQGAGISETLQEEMVRIIDDCEFSRYAPSSEKSDMDTLYGEAIRLLHNLDQNIRTK